MSSLCGKVRIPPTPQKTQKTASTLRRGGFFIRLILTAKMTAKAAP